MSQFYDQASLVMVPSGYKNGKLYSQKPLSTSGELSFSRASNATRVVLDASGQQRLEKVRENLVLQSNTFNTTWATVAASVTSGQSGYDGTSNAWLLTKSIASGRVEQSLSTLSSASNTLSVYVKANASTWCAIEYGTSYRYLNLSTGAVSSGSGDYNVQSLANGWYRFSINSSSATGTFRIYPAEADDISALSGSIFIQNAQAETGDIATDPITTLGSAVSVGPVSGLPRLDYSGGASCPSLLLEPQRTNVIQNSENLSAANWTKTSCTISTNVATAPDGTASADKVIMNNGVSPTIAGADGIYQVSSITSGVYSVSFFAKAAEFNSVNVRDNAITGAFLNINLTTGAVTNPAPSQFVGAKAVSFGNGWYRVSFTTSTIVATQAFSIRAGQTGDGTSGFLLWGVQYELGAYATSYIPTLSSAVTRVADAASKTGISSLIGQTEGVLYIELEGVNYSPTGGAQLCSIDDGTTLKRMELFANTSNLIGVYVQDVSAQVNFTSAVPATGRIKIALAYKLNDYALYVNGNLVHTDTSGTVPTVSALRLFGRYDGLANGSQGVKQALLFKTRLSNADLATLTTL